MRQFGLRDFISVVVLIALTLPAAAQSSFPVRVNVEVGSAIRRVPPLLYGQNIEWTSNGDNLWNPMGGHAKKAMIALVKPIHPALIRFPGGSLSNCYRWEWGISPMAARKPNMVWFSARPSAAKGIWSLEGGSTAPNDYGFDDHMRFIREVGAKGALVTVNATYFPGSPQYGGSPQEAAAWVAYANAGVSGRDVKIGTDYRGIDYHSSRYWARLRAKNGHPAPYNVRYWEIGNEVNDVSQGAGLSGRSYAERVHQYAELMHAVDPSVRIGAVLGFRWLKDILSLAGRDISFLIYHFYAPGIDNQGFTLWSNGSKDIPLSVTADDIAVIVHASGTPADGGWPDMVVSIDGKQVGSYTITADQRKGDFNEERIPIHLPPGKHVLAVAFTNDMMTKTEDRNLFIDGIWVETSNHQRSAVSVINPTDMMHLLASEPSAFANRFQAVRQAIHRYAPMRAGHIHVFVTEFNAMYSMNGNSPHQIRQLKSALMVDGILQRMLTEPLCQETNYWCLNSWYFQIVQMGRNGSFFYSPQGLVYRIMQPLYHGEVVRSVVQSPDFPPPHAMPIPAATKVTAVAVRNGRQLAVNLVNYDVSGTARIALRISGKFAARRSRLLLCTGPSADSENSTADPRLVHLTEQTPRITAQAVDFNLPAHSCATLILSEGAK